MQGDTGEEASVMGQLRLDKITPMKLFHASPRKDSGPRHQSFPKLPQITISSRITRTGTTDADMLPGFCGAEDTVDQMDFEGLLIKNTFATLLLNLSPKRWIATSSATLRLTMRIGQDRMSSTLLERGLEDLFSRCVREKEHLYSED